MNLENLKKVRNLIATGEVVWPELSIKEKE